MWGNRRLFYTGSYCSKQNHTSIKYLDRCSNFFVSSNKYFLITKRRGSVTPFLHTCTAGINVYTQQNENTIHICNVLLCNIQWTITHTFPQRYFIMQYLVSVIITYPPCIPHGCVYVQQSTNVVGVSGCTLNRIGITFIPFQGTCMYGIIRDPKNINKLISRMRIFLKVCTFPV